MLASLRIAGRLLLRHWLTTCSLTGVILVFMTTHILERMFVYFPSREIEADPSSIGLAFQDIHPQTQDGIKLHGWFVPHVGARTAFLLFHGNAGNISHRLDWIQMLHDLGTQIVIIDYRGYGNSEGKPFEQGLYLDALATYDWWIKNHGAEGNKLVLFGESLGGAVAVDLAAKVPVDGIVLQSTFTSAKDMARAMIPLGLLQPIIGVRFDSASKIRSLRCPKLFIHGSLDETVPYILGRKLYTFCLPPKNFYVVNHAGHNDLLTTAGETYSSRLRTFLSGIEP